MKRSIIDKSLKTGVRVIDGLLTLGEGQRVSIMAGSGVGKSTLMGMLAKNSSADINVIALVGERGREVREFIERDLGTGLTKSVVVVSTSDVSPALQIKGVQAAMSVAEFFRDQGKAVLVMTDSLTRLAMAQRQIGLSAGEPPTSKGYPPSVFTMLPRLLERGGTGENGGSITLVSTVLIEADDINDPIGDTVRSIVDGHIVLSRRLVSYGHYPPVDVLESLSRTMPSTTTLDHQKAAIALRRIMAIYHENEELIRLGAYKRGADPQIDLAIQLKTQIDAFLQQDRVEVSTFEKTIQSLTELQGKIERTSKKRPSKAKK
jgi:flagellum-specific ATP synthase